MAFSPYSVYIHQILRQINGLPNAFMMTKI
jgi:hypothetical protein